MAPPDISDPRLMALVDEIAALPTSLRAEYVLAELLGGTNDAMSLGDRDRLLWAFKRRRFGVRAVSAFDCVDCAETISFAVPADFDLPKAEATVAEVLFGAETYRLRLPQMADIRHHFAAEQLCPEAPWSDLTFRDLAAQALDTADPGMDVVFDIDCPACGQINPRSLDVAAFVWADIAASVDQLMTEVAILARGFGWTEQDSLRLSPSRRARYVEMLQ